MLEIEFLKVSDHPNVIRYYETFEDTQYIYLVMEMCSGGTVWQHVQTAHDMSGFGVAEVDLAKVMMQMLRGVAYCHANAIVHRDLKPENFLFGWGEPQSGSFIPVSAANMDVPLKLVDFGASGVIRGDRPDKRLLTKTVGTRGYIAPEIMKNRPYGQPVDMFSLGAILHTMIVGKTPRWNEDSQSYEFPGRLRWRALSPQGQAFLTRLVDVEPLARPTAQEAIQDPWFQAMCCEGQKALPELHQECIASIREFARRSRLQRAVMYSIVAFAPLCNEHMERLTKVFLMANTGGSGEITLEEFEQVAKSYQAPLKSLTTPLESTEALFAAVDSSQSARISYSEWLAAAAPQAWFDNHENARRAFNVLDGNGDGQIGASQLCELLPDVFCPQGLEHEIRCLYPTGNGTLSFGDFCTLAGQIYTDAVI